MLTTGLFDSPVGATALPDGACSFRVWAPARQRIDLRLPDRAGLIRMHRDAEGYHCVSVSGVQAGARYTFILDEDLERPDPASRFQPEGVRGPSAVVAHHFAWTDAHWFGRPLRDYIIYELHVGSFSREGTFAGVIRRLPELVQLGITALELMPLAQFSGSRNWGYDGVLPFAVQNSYGGPEGLRALVDAAHAHGLAVILDVVYNHLGPEGNYLPEFGPYFTERYKTPWGGALNFDGEQSDHVRRFFLQNALDWQSYFHIDALRLDAVHAIHDHSATPFLTELARATHERSVRLNRRFHLIAESDLNDVRLILPECLGGQGIDAQWSDDFHHALHVLLTGEGDGYYADFTGGLAQFAKALQHGFVYTGQYSPARKRRHGNSPRLAAPEQLVVYSQNHDQIGNRARGERLAHLASFESQKLAAAAVILSPYTPLLFMGEEYGEAAPFQYFVSHSDPELIKAVRQGRSQEFAAFAWQGELPDPQAEATFQQCILNPLGDERQNKLREFYRKLIVLRKQLLQNAPLLREDVNVETYLNHTIVLRYGTGEPVFLVAFCFAQDPVSLPWLTIRSDWELTLDSAAGEWLGPGSGLAQMPGADASGGVILPPRSVAIWQKRKCLDGASEPAAKPSERPRTADTPAPHRVSPEHGVLCPTA
ncbi:MAG: malto-oligosyltrehalose trehalohydrolase [Verrucomicrobiota bacterium]